MTIQDFHEYVVTDVLSGLGEALSSRRMFGGYGLYLDGKIFGVILSDGELAFKVGDNNRQDYVDAGSKQWVYEGHKNKKPTAMPYWYAPDEIMDNPQVAADWARKAAENSK